MIATKLTVKLTVPSGDIQGNAGQCDCLPKCTCDEEDACGGKAPKNQTQLHPKLNPQDHLTHPESTKPTNMI